MHLSEVLADLIAEQRALDAIVSRINDEEWALPTPSPRWSITDQIGHLTFFDGTAALAITDEPAFIAHRSDFRAKLADPPSVDDATLADFRSLSPKQQLAAWRGRREALETAAHTLADDSRVEWYGPSMGAKSFLTARLMEVWAHGQDVVDTLTAAGIAAERSDTDRLRHIAQLGVITRGWSYLVRGATAPDADIRVELEAPSGTTWEWGPADATQSVSGPAGDFCRVVTQRRNVADTELDVVGDEALDWMQKAQAFAGAPTTGPEPQRRTR
ncbi:MAG TPA: TIGR03084 family metal-binding protein [Ilumatobacter sp.]|nr:TIGR03084 family metal-binding protein [Ilumatobacter sp.]